MCVQCLNNGLSEAKIVKKVPYNQNYKKFTIHARCFCDTASHTEGGGDVHSYHCKDLKSQTMFFFQGFRILSASTV